jgi:protein gp37
LSCQVYNYHHFSAIFDPDDDEAERFRYIDWVIVGGESGPNARPMHPDWARSLRDQCQAAGVPFMFKQWGEWGPDWEGAETCNACGRTKFDALDAFTVSA